MDHCETDGVEGLGFRIVDHCETDGVPFCEGPSLKGGRRGGGGVPFEEWPSMFSAYCR